MLDVRMFGSFSIAPAQESAHEPAHGAHAHATVGSAPDTPTLFDPDAFIVQEDDPAAADPIDLLNAEDAAATSAPTVLPATFAEPSATEPVAGTIVATSRARRIWALIAYLILHRDREVSVTELYDILWPDESRTDPLKTLQHNVSRARSLLEETGVPGARDFIMFRAGSYQWNPTCELEVDAEEFEGLISALPQVTDPDKRIRALERIIALYRGDFLPVLEEASWVVPIATRFRTMFTEACIALAREYERQGRWPELESVCQRGLAIVPENEALNALYVRVLTEIGEPAKALEAYKAATKVLGDRLGVVPSDELRDAHEDAVTRLSVGDLTTDDLREFIIQEGVAQGGKSCDWSIFYSLASREMRNAGRVEDKSVVLLLGFDSEFAGKTNCRRVRDVLTDNLRSGDYFTCLNDHQFAALLPEVGIENVPGIAGRLQIVFNRRFPRAGFPLRIEWLTLE